MKKTANKNEISGFSESIPTPMPISCNRRRLLTHNFQSFNMISNALTVSISSERYHVLANMECNLISDCRGTILQEVLNEIIAMHIRADIDQGHAGTTRFLFGDFTNVRMKEFVSTGFQCLFDDFGGELICAVCCGVLEDDFKGSKTILWMSMFDNVLDDPISPLTTGNGVDIFKNLFNTRPLR